MRYLTWFLVSTVAFNAIAFDVEAVISRMEATGRTTMIGKDASCGSYVICRTQVEIGKDVNFSREQAKLEARTTIAELFSVKVSGTSSRTTTTQESIKDENESFAQSEFAQSVVRKDINQVQRGISICKEMRVGTKLVVYSLLTEQVVDATADLEKAMKKLGPDTVRTTGVGYYNEVVSVAKAHEVALSEAQRNAIAEVMGMSMTSSSAKQSISAEGVDNDGEETFACDDSFKCRAFSACAGFIESSRIVDEKKTESAVCVTIVAKVARGKLMDDYRAYLESMGNPGFCVRSNDPTMLSACSGFFAELGLRVVGNVYSAAYVIDAVGGVEGEVATVTITAKDKTAGNVLFSVSNSVRAEGSPTAAYVQALTGMKAKLHAGLDQFIGRANADGRKVTVRLCNYDREYKAVADVVKNGLENIPGAKNVRKGKVKSDTVEFTLNYIGDTQDLADFLEKHIKTDVKRRRHRPSVGRVENTLVEFDFE